MNIAFDIDGVLTDFEYFLDTYGHRYFSKKFKVNAKVKNPYSTSVAKRFGYGDKEEVAFYKRYLLWYSLKMPIRENAAVTISQLREEGNKVYLVTARALANRSDIFGSIMRCCLKLWLWKHKVHVDGIYYVSVSDSAIEKKEWMKKLHIDYMVEDEPKNGAAISEICNVIYFATSYNDRVENGKRAMDFGEVYRIIHADRFQKVKQLPFEERDRLAEHEKKIYFEELLNFYKEIPFDKAYLKNLQHFMKWFVPIPAFFLRLLTGMVITEGSLPASEKGVIYVCNHRRSLDVPMCYCILKNVRPRILTKREYEEKAIGKLMGRLGIIFLDREKKESGKRNQNLMIQTLVHGGNIMLFPEGTRNRTDKRLLPFKFGAVYMAQVTGAPIVPITIRRVSRNKHLIRIGKKMYIDVLDCLEEKNQELHHQMEMMYQTGCPL